MSLNLIALAERNFKLQQILVAILDLFFILNSLCFSTSGAEKLRREPSNKEQAWLISQPSRNTWGEPREFNKVSLVSQIIGYKPRLNNKNNAKCMDKNLREAPNQI